MNPTTTLDVVRDAVQIGLGALIGLLSAWLLAAYGSKRELVKMRFERRSRIVEQCVADLEDVFLAWSKYSSALRGLASIAESEPKDGAEADIVADYLARESHGATTLRAEFIQKVQAAMHVQSKLLLLGEPQCKAAVDVFLLSVTKADESYKYDGETMDLSDYVTTHRKVIAAREALYSRLSESFSSEK